MRFSIFKKVGLDFIESSICNLQIPHLLLQARDTLQDVLGVHRNESCSESSICTEPRQNMKARPIPIRLFKIAQIPKSGFPYTGRIN